ncbi:MAG: hypothetical protein ACREPC_10360, partial [Stenotrophomonas sp.]
MLSQHLLFFFAMLGAFNGIGLASFLWWGAQGQAPLRWLSLLILAVGVRTGKSVAFYFWPDIPRIVLQFGLTACFLIGPCLFFLVRACQSDAPGRWRIDRWHVAALLVVAVGTNLFLPYTGYPELWRYVITPGINYVWLGYLLLTAVQLYRHRTALAGAPTG